MVAVHLRSRSVIQLAVCWATLLFRSAVRPTLYELPAPRGIDATPYIRFRQPRPISRRRRRSAVARARTPQLFSATRIQPQIVPALPLARGGPKLRPIQSRRGASRHNPPGATCNAISPRAAVSLLRTHSIRPRPGVLCSCRQSQHWRSGEEEHSFLNHVASSTTNRLVSRTFQHLNEISAKILRIAAKSPQTLLPPAPFERARAAALSTATRHPFVTTSRSVKEIARPQTWSSRIHPLILFLHASLPRCGFARDAGWLSLHGSRARRPLLAISDRQNNIASRA